MTDREFDLIDALYFTLSFQDLEKELGWEPHILKEALQSLIAKGWVKSLRRITDEEVDAPDVFEREFRNLNYLATKQGLLEHNSR